MKKLNRTAMLFFFMFLFVIPQGFPQKPAQDAPALIQKVLEHALTSDSKVPDYNLLKKKNKIVVSRAVVNKFHSDITSFHSDLYPPETFPEQIGNAKLIQLSKPEIQILADKKGDYLYLQIGEISVTGDRAEIGVSTNWAVSKKTKIKSYNSGGGYILEFIKENGEWKFNGERRRWQS